MVREYTGAGGARGTTVPVPRTLYLGDADGPLGAPFYVMERVLGHICRNELPPGYADTPAQRRAIGEALVDTLAALHTVDPAAVGLGGVRTARRLHGAPAAPLVEAVGGDEDRRAAGPRRAARRPRARPARHSARTRSSTATTGSTTRSCTRRSPAAIVAVLDWEMSTLGDPFTDFGALLAFWSEDGDAEVLRDARIVAPVTAAPGFPSRDEVIERYAARRASMSPTPTGTRPSRSSSWPSSARASPPAARAGPRSARASTMLSGS